MKARWILLLMSIPATMLVLLILYGKRDDYFPIATGMQVFNIAWFGGMLLRRR